jgi:hypothetical protein
MPRKSKNPKSRVNSAPQDPDGNLWLVVKQLDSQARTIIQLLDQIGKHLDSLDALIETKLGERMERLRQDFRTGLAAIVSGGDATGDAHKVVLDFLFNKNKPKS